MIRISWMVIIILTAPGPVGGALVMVDAQPLKSSEYDVKAIFLYNFTKFVQWPEETFSTPDAPVVICVLGENPFGNTLEVIRNESGRKRRIDVRYPVDAADTAGCHLLYISPSEKEKTERILEQLTGRPCLTVSDMEAFTHKGGMIHMFRNNKKIRFEVNLKAAERARLKISSRLLKLARIKETE